MNDPDNLVKSLQRQLAHERAERQHAEAVLYENQRMLAGLMHNLPGMAYRCRVDSGWTMEFVSEGSLALTGYAPDDLMGNHRITYGSLIHPDDREQVQQTVHAALQAQQPFEVTYRLITASGAEKWVWEQGRRVESDGGDEAMVGGFITDMSQRVQAQQQLERRVQERTRQLTTLLEVQRALSSRLDPEAVMQMIAEEARQLLGGCFGALFVREDEMLRVAALAGTYGPDMKVGYGMPLRQSATGLALLSGQVVRIDGLDDPRIYRGAMEAAHIQSMVGIPLRAGENPIGVISVGNAQPNAFSEADEHMLALLAPGAAIALENARLYKQAQQAAALEERQRLARDLHDAVTQTLFSASMIADVLPRLWERTPDEGRRRLDELRQLTRGALAEMRTLLLELRPTALIEADLGDILHQLGEATTGRSRLLVCVTVDGEEPLPPEVRVTFYRIAQEAVQNVVKHAGAQQIDLSLHLEPGSATLHICDDGCGFDVAHIEGGHFGLRIMGERAEAVGATLRVVSRPGHGTTITVTWMKSGEEEHT